MLTSRHARRSLALLVPLALVLTTFTSRAAADPLPAIDAGTGPRLRADEAPSIDHSTTPELPGRGLRNAGILTSAIGGAALTFGGVAMVINTNDGSEACSAKRGFSCQIPYLSGVHLAGFSAMVGGFVTIAAGIPMIIIGAKRMQASQRPAEASLAPELALGPARASLAWRF
jgi:hypothetical protein